MRTSSSTPKPAALAAAFLLSAAGFAFAQGPQQQPLRMVQLKPNVYAGLDGGGGNSTIVIGNTGVIVVDAKTSEMSGKALVDEIAKITPKPITTVIETHSDGDHINGLAGFPKDVKVIANEGDKKEQEAAIAAGGRGAPPADRLPSLVTTKQKETMTLDGVKFELYHWAPAHTSGDLVVYLPDQKICATGDVVMANMADDNPLIHPEKNGSTAGWITNVKGIVGLNADTYVPGHGDLLKKADVQRKLDATSAKRDRIVAAIKAGKTLDEIKAEFPNPPPAAGAGRGPAPGGAPPAGGPGGPAAAGPGAAAGRGPGGGGRGPQPTFAELVYNEVTKK